MEDGQHLKLLLQIQLASDISAAQNLPFVLNSLSPQSLLPSSHLTKWTTRINSLLHSKDACARWAGLWIAHKTSACSRSIMIEFGQNWLSVALPLLSKNEPAPVLKAAIRLARIIFTSLTDMPEFQRQVSNPNIPKFIASLIQTAQHTPESEVKLECIWTFCRLVPLYPAAHRASHSALSKLALSHLSGNPSGITPRSLVEACSALYCVLHFTGGKVGAAGLWRNSLEETLHFGWSSFLALRTTFPSSGFHNTRQPASQEEPNVSVPFNLERLRSSVAIMCDLLGSVTHRHIQLPLGNIIQFATALLTVDEVAQVDGFVDPITRSMEVAAVPSIIQYGSQFLRAIILSARSHLIPHTTRLLTVLGQCIDRKPTSELLVLLFGALDSLLKFSPSVGSSSILNRTATVVISYISTRLLSSHSSQNGLPNEGAVTKSRKGKKRARNYEGDEVFSVTKEVACPTEVDGKALLAALDVLHHLLRNEDLPTPILSICSRTVLSLNLVLPQSAPALLSPDSGLFRQVHSKVRNLAITIACGTSSTMSRSLPLVLENATSDSNEECMFDLILHPRVPPLLRSMPAVEALTLHVTEESEEEKRIRDTLGMETLQDTSEDTIMRNDESSTATASLPIPSVEHFALTLVAPPAISAVQHDSTVAIQPKSAPVAVTAAQQSDMNITDREPPLEKPVSLAKQTFTQPLPRLESASVGNNDSENDEEGEMPTIDMASDSEEEDL